MPKTSAGMKIKVLDPFQDAKTLWLGLDKPELNQIRKVFQLITPQTVGSKHIMAGITIFSPGEASSLHNHPESEEMDVVIKGSGEVVDGNGNRRPFKEGDYMFIPEGEYHQHVNTGNEPLWLLWCYSPQGSLPED
ncbi:MULTISPECIES: cupin domain-containing protein [Aeribacillus]|jgi:Thermophilic glucose-6-phosphate isomerase and related metalloenzymes|uniref:Cupin domain-containing protein n=1 Tax=Aeribacillus composti TaxID=1868734 RepID=A0ABY9WHG4_9BACI|nr:MULTISPECIES: cupin domain-containing protein [Aeribacillus]MDR9792984.1 cupin domain-containing protein [Aeribacillus pallidus]MDR9798078.1 cupin domain-containing protein [Aeribacillus pallidus]MED0651327.1 cupin domain-containing protein [Aeribacillus composti]MED0701611.1 cupin domain-containing protein [Aeribacillus composti]MED1440373.1 cupin domain-containing protein [Aeribacillus composti]